MLIKLFISRWVNKKANIILNIWLVFWRNSDVQSNVCLSFPPKYSVLFETALTRKRVHQDITQCTYVSTRFGKHLWNCFTSECKCVSVYMCLSCDGLVLHLVCILIITKHIMMLTYISLSHSCFTGCFVLVTLCPCCIRH